MLTVEEFAALPESLDGSHEELFRGEVVSSPVPKARHGATLSPDDRRT
jgi:hypothetical protein